MTPLERIQLKNQIERILHIPGNYTGGILEMALVLDYHMPLPLLEEKSKDLLLALKMQGEIFRNIRLNVIKWESDDCIIKTLSSTFEIQTGKLFLDYDEIKKNPESGNSQSLDELTRQLKLFYARSKLILVLTQGEYMIRDKKQFHANLQPFLHRKMLLLENGEIIPLTKLLVQ